MGEHMTTRIVTDSNGRKHITTEPLLHPPQRTWVGLTGEERFEIRMHSIENMGENFQETLCKAIESKLKEKNT